MKFKKAQIPATITWMAVIIIILFLEILFLVGMLVLSLSGDRKNVIVKEGVDITVENLDVQKNFENILDFEIEGEKLLEVIKKSKKPESDLERDFDFSRKIGKVLKGICDKEIYLDTPKGTVNGDGTYRQSFPSGYVDVLTSAVLMEIPYEDRVFEIKFRMSRKCFEE